MIQNLCCEIKILVVNIVLMAIGAQQYPETSDSFLGHVVIYGILSFSILGLCFLAYSTIISIISVYKILKALKQEGKLTIKEIFKRIFDSEEESRPAT